MIEIVCHLGLAGSIFATRTQCRIKQGGVYYCNCNQQCINQRSAKLLEKHRWRPSCGHTANLLVGGLTPNDAGQRVSNKSSQRIGQRNVSCGPPRTRTVCGAPASLVDRHHQGSSFVKLIGAVKRATISLWLPACVCFVVHFDFHFLYGAICNKICGGPGHIVFIPC